MSDALALRLAPDVAAARGGDHRAFARLVDATRNTVTSITLAILHDVEMSRDVAQEVYLLVWRDLRRLREPASFLPWLRQLTRNRAHQALRGRVRQRRRLAADADSLLAAAADPRPDALEHLVSAEERAALADAVAALPAAVREVVLLYYREGRSAAQVAALLDLSEEAVRQRLSRARKHLRTMLVPVIERSAPGVAFTAAVLAGVTTLAAPATASAAVVAAGKAGKVGGILPGFMGAGALGALGGLAGGWASIAFGTRDLLRLARDDEERRGVLGVGALCMLATLGFAVAILVESTPRMATAGFVVMMSCIAVAHFIWLPRITRRRHEAELREDPVGAAAQHRRRRLQARIGFAVGTLLGGGTVLASWFF
jgi:RNA polymerase sigma factor (sigma-70 family)